jgi:DNA-binding transcriptional regulator YdaS (Cro superfamily)
MKLDEYLTSPGAPSMTELRLKMRALGYAVKSNAQIRQWRYGYEDRGPSPENCVGIELATEGAVSRKELRPHDWWLLWPELDGSQVERMKASDDAQPPVGGTNKGTKQARAQIQ